MTAQKQHPFPGCCVFLQYVLISSEEALHTFVLGVKYVLRGAFFDDDTVGHEDDLIGDVAGEGHLVGDDHHRDVQILQGLDDLQDFPGEFRVEGALRRRL